MSVTLKLVFHDFRILVLLQFLTVVVNFGEL